MTGTLQASPQHRLLKLRCLTSKALSSGTQRISILHNTLSLGGRYTLSPPGEYTAPHCRSVSTPAPHHLLLDKQQLSQLQQLLEQRPTPTHGTSETATQQEAPRSEERRVGKECRKRVGVE